MTSKHITLLILLLTTSLSHVIALGMPVDSTIAVWLFDEHQNLYPSSVLNEVGPNEYVLVLGRGGKLTNGKFGNALKVTSPSQIRLPEGDFNTQFGLKELPVPAGRSVPPMTWHNANFSALMTLGEKHLRNQVGFANPTLTDLNLGDFDWTVEFWLNLEQSDNDQRVIFEIGSGPRGENDLVTRLLLKTSGSIFQFKNQPGARDIAIPTDMNTLNDGWNHLAFTYEAGTGQIRHYVNGILQEIPQAGVFRPLATGDEAYFSIGRSGTWDYSLDGTIDELRFSKGIVYSQPFETPGSLKTLYLPKTRKYDLIEGPELLFSNHRDDTVVELGNRKHLFIDDALLDRQQNVQFSVNPPRIDRQVIKVDGSFRKHLTVLEDHEGRIRLYTALNDDYLGVFISDDGISFRAPDTGIHHKGHTNIVIPERVGVGTVFIDPNADDHTRYKYISDVNRRGLYVYTSPNGIEFTRYRQAVAPFRSGSQNDIYYDDQRQVYIGFHRSDYARTPGGRTLRDFVMTEIKDLFEPWHFDVPDDEAIKNSDKMLDPITPWYLDNGPITPGGWGIEYPTVFAWDPDIDPVTAGIYNPKAIKYPWAPDTYVAFPIWYFHYYERPQGRMIHALTRGGGPTETQFASSRDGLHWKRYPRPVYSGIGIYDGLDIRQTFISQGMIRRGDEIWQYVFLDNDYHTANERSYERRVYRLVQRLDGFVSIDSPYESYGEIITRPLRFEGEKLALNIDTDAHGYATVAILDEQFRPVPGFGHEEAVFINGDHTEIHAEWMNGGTSLSEHQGKIIRLSVRMKGSKLYAMQFQ
jgi:hypothetical protein